MIVRFGLGLLATVVLCACGPQVALEDSGGGTTDGPSSTDDPVATFGTAAETETPGTASGSPTTDAGDSIGDADVDDGSGADSTGFIDTGCGIEASAGETFRCSPEECDPFAQDCPDGEKCMPWANDGGSEWNAFKCSVVSDEPGQAGDACMVEGSGVSGIDDCDIGLMCFWVDASTNAGRCVPLCEGSSGSPTCADGSTCIQSSDGVLALCLGTCDPILDDCAFGHCLPTDHGFACIDVELGDLPPGSPCEFAQDCAAGSSCLDASLTGDCGGPRCCTSYCDLGVAEPGAVCSADQVCTAWWERGEAPEPWTDLGVCVVRMQ